MDRVHEADDVVLALGLLEGGVVGEERLLGRGIGLAGDQLGLLVDEAQPTQHGGHATDGVADPEARLDPGGDVLGAEIWR